MVFRRLRGLLGIMTTWGIVFATIASVAYTGLVLFEEPTLTFRYLPMMALRGFIAGALSGALFAALLIARERRKTVSTMSLGRVTLWGFLGGAALPVLSSLALGNPTLTSVSEILIGGAIAGTAGSVIAATMVWIAQREPRLANAQRSELPSRLTEVR